MKKQMIQVLKNHAIANVHLHKTNIDVYFANPAGIGEHSELLPEFDKWVGKLAEAKDKLEALEELV